MVPCSSFSALKRRTGPIRRPSTRHSKKGTRSVIDTEERRQGDLVVG